MKKSIIIYNTGDYGIMMEDQSFRKRFPIFSKKKWWNVSGDYGLGCNIGYEKKYHILRDWVLERAKEYNDKNIQIEIVNESRYDIFNFF
jgi:hypothetical protein